MSVIAPPGSGELTQEQLLEGYRVMRTIREFEERLHTEFATGEIPGFVHLYAGEEAIAAGVCAHLRPDDFVASTHRGHGHSIAKGCDVKAMMAEIYGKQTGICHGKGGSMHIADLSKGMLGANGIVGGGFGLAAGAALSAQMRGSGQVALCFFGDGALNQGAFLECGNLAAVWRLPLVLLCENNHFAMSKRPEEVTAVEHLHDRAAGLGIPGQAVDGMRVLDVHDAVAAAVARAREGHGPSLLVADCYRLAGHFSGDSQSYRSREEVAEAARRDPIRLFAGDLVTAGVLTEPAVGELTQEAETLVARALEHAEAAPLPRPEEAFEDLDD